MNYLYGLKFRLISDHSMHTANLNLLFYREGFSYSVDNGRDSRPMVHDFQVEQSLNWEAEIIREFELNLSLRRNFSQVRASFVSTFFNVVPAELLDENLEVLLNFSEAEFENNRLLSSQSVFGASLVFGISQLLFDKLNLQYANTVYCHSGKVLMDSVAVNSEPFIHLHLSHQMLEILVSESDKLLYYNLFETPTAEDVLFYSLYVADQFGFDTNTVNVKTYGELMEGRKIFELLRKYVRRLSQAVKEEVYMKNYSLYKLSECELSQVHSREKK
ncbi:MAG: DUF3822 family protein [Weeksellaceae bacterium]|nr:DUF3822 family protein [Weeksellaceae bacterium]